MKILLSEEQLRQGIARLAGQIEECYDGRPLTVVGVLIGSVILLADLVRQLSLPLRVEMVQTRSYRGSSTRPGQLTLNVDLLSGDLRGRDVLLVDDIFDTGHTLAALLPEIERLQPASVRTAVLLRKADRCEVAVQPDFVAFDIPDEFVVGFGLDYRDQYRHLPYLAALEPSDLASPLPNDRSSTNSHDHSEDASR